MVLSAIFVAGGVAADVYAEQFMSGLPSVRGLDTANFSGDTIITDRTGRLLADVGDNGDHRVVIPLKDISPHVVEATIAIEDRNFYKNQGFDVQGIVRSALTNYRSRTIVGGGSTITQQLAKQLFLTPDQTYQRKAREVVLAWQLSQTYSKDQILELYLNKTYYGSQSYGIQSAARQYFHKDAKDLDIAESAMLAGLPQAPSEWNPVIHPEAAALRQREVLTAMVRSDFITQADADRAASRKLQINPPVNTFQAPHFVDQILSELRRLGFKPGQQHLFVTTTLDLDKQRVAERIVRSNLADQKYRDPQGLLDSALVAMDPRTGQVIAMVGSPDYNAVGGQINLTTTPRNPGSSLKPFTYAAVLSARKATMDTPIYDGPSPLEFPDGPGRTYKVYNYDRGTHGNRPLRQALAGSLNIPAIKAEVSVGVPAVVEFMRNIGIRPRAEEVRADGSAYLDPRAPLNDYGLSVTLGGYPVTLLEEVTGYATIASLGVYHEPEMVLSVKDPKGTVLYQANPDLGRRQAVDPGVAFILAQIMSDDANRAYIFNYGSPLHLPDRRAAAKTGTTDNFKDALTAGFTPDLATVVWVGDIGPIDSTMNSNSDGVYVAAPAWNAFMQEALRGQPDRWFEPPPNVVAGYGNSWYLADATKVDRLPNDSIPSPSPRPSAGSQVPPDPGAPQRGPAPPTPAATPQPGPIRTPTPSPSPTRRPD